MAGPTLRTDLVLVLAARRNPLIEVLQLRRAEPPFQGTWQPIMGGIRPNESAVRAAWREAQEETGITPDQVRGFWHLDQAPPFLYPQRDEIFLVPGFGIEVGPGWEPRLNEEHDAHRWIDPAEAERLVLWPGHRVAVAELAGLLAEGSPAESHQRLSLPVD